MNDKGTKKTPKEHLVNETDEGAKNIILEI
jgi:hypothetical protein